MAYYVYILKSLVTDKFYVGSTQDLEARLIRHNEGRSKFTKPFRPWKIVHTERFETRSEATKRERTIKNRKSSAYIESLVRTSRR